MTDLIDKDNGLAPWLEDLFQMLRTTHQRQRLGHALLIGGPRGVGKTVLAETLARYLIAPSGAACGSGSEHPDWHRVEPPEGKVALGVDQIREVCSKLALTSHGGGCKVAMVIPAEAMTLSAANALLKTLEEPTEQTYLILVSHQPGRLPATIRSRCQSYTVSRPNQQQALAWLSGQKPDPDVDWATLLGYADGAPLLALELSDGDIYKFNNTLEDEIKAISNGEADPVKIAERWTKNDPERCLGWLAQELKALIRNLARGNEITDWPRATLHNVPSNGRLRALIARADRLERVRSLISGGVNTEMALRALLLEFAPGTLGHSE